MWIPDVVTLTTIASTWGNSIRNQIVQVFASTAEANAHLTVPDGALSTVPSAGRTVYGKWAGAWYPVTPIAVTGALVGGPYLDAGIPAQTWATCAIPAGYTRAVALYHVFCNAQDLAGQLYLELKVFSAAGGIQMGTSRFLLAGAGDTATLIVSGPINVNGDNIAVTAFNAGTKTLYSYTDNQNHQLTVLAYP